MNPLQRQQQIELERIEICGEILTDSANELYLGMRFLDMALHSLKKMPDPGVRGFSTDGAMLWFYPESVISLYRKDKILVNRTYLHLILHCILGHLWKQPGEDAGLWQTACDIAVESIIDRLDSRCVHLPMGPYRKMLYRKMEASGKVMTAERIYRWLQKMQLQEEEKQQMREEFYRDDHSRWHGSSNQRNALQQKRWEDIRGKMQTEMETFAKEASHSSKGLLEQVRAQNRPRYCYRDFLRKFAVLKEEQQVDPDSFDYIFYNYGISLYGNMPLIEPMETKEVHKVEDFVIAIDTSMSCQGELVKQFLRETYGCLSERGSFFCRVNVHIIQCDEQIQSDRLITSQEELQDYMEHFEIKGRGGTDFRPVFGYVNTLLARQAFFRLRGLIYFTDGYGTFPAKRPAYETAFVFMQEDYRDADVPPWAIKLILEPEDLKNEHKKSEGRN